jgi:hypothetical protein|tara:strand:- start:1841 stop:2062 length:222 start_codon:yes stop_codon:yes gene_type:complete
MASRALRAQPPVQRGRITGFPGLMHGIPSQVISDFPCTAYHQVCLFEYSGLIAKDILPPPHPSFEVSVRVFYR